MWGSKAGRASSVFGASSAEPSAVTLRAPGAVAVLRTEAWISMPGKVRAYSSENSSEMSPEKSEARTRERRSNSVVRPVPLAPSTRFTDGLKVSSVPGRTSRYRWMRNRVSFMACCCTGAGPHPEADAAG